MTSEEKSLQPGLRKPVLGEAFLIALPSHSDARGNLAVAEFSELPFMPQRMFFVHDVPSQYVRGEHAHRICQQLLVCVEGSVAVVVDDGRTREEVLLDTPGLGLYIPANLWTTQYRHQPHSVVAVFASHPYDPDDYIRDYNEFIDLAGKKGTCRSVK